MDPLKLNWLLDRYRKGECSNEEKKIVEDWFGAIELYPGLELEKAEKAEVQKRLATSIHKRIDEVENGAMPLQRTPWYRGRWARMAVAAAVFIPLLFFVLYGNLGNGIEAETASATALKRVKNTTNHEIVEVLPDQSTVILKPGSTLQYAGLFDGNIREVELTGNAFFEIKRDERRPFFVYCEKAVTRVLGTSFWVKTDEKSRTVEVVVKTGRVSVYNKKEEKAGTPGNVVLVPNQKAVVWLDNGREKLKEIMVEPAGPDEIIRPAGYLFEDEPVATVFRQMELEYGLKMAVPYQDMKSCTFTGDLTGMSMLDKLDLVCGSVRARYEIRDNMISVSGGGCSQ